MRHSISSRSQKLYKFCLGGIQEVSEFVLVESVEWQRAVFLCSMVYKYTRGE